MRFSRHHSATSGIALLAALVSAPAFGQNSDTSSAAAPQQASGSTSVGIADIIVTAQRRQERNQDVPIAITAFSNEQIDQQNIDSAQDLNAIVPSLQVNAEGQATRGAESFTLRGVGTSYQGTASVAIYLADVPLAQGITTNQQGGQGNFVDLENLQALAGPQGTLFGRNTTGGAILLVPRKPTNEFGGYIEGSVGNYDYRGLEGVLNVPIISDKLMVRVVGNYQDREGFTRDVLWNKSRDDMHYYSGRIGILFNPTERISNYLMAFGSKSSTNGTSYVLNEYNIPFLTAVGFCAAPCSVFQEQNDRARELGPRRTRPGVDQYDKDRTWGVINRTSIELSDQLTLNNIISYQRFKKDFLTDEDGTPLQWVDIGASRYPNFPVPGLVEFGIAPNGFSNGVETGPRDDQEQFSEELQLQGSLLDNHLTFTAGLFYLNQNQFPQLNRPLIACGAFSTGTAACTPSIQTYEVGNKTKAIYGQTTFDAGALTPALESLRFTAGYRYSWDKIKGSASYYSPFPGGVFCLASGSLGTVPNDCLTSANLKYKSPTWTVGADYKPVSELLLYAKVSRGYKAGGFNAFATRPETAVFNPEKLISYEAGFKSNWQLGSVPLRFNVAAYKSDYDNIQIARSDGLAGVRYAQSKAALKGMEAELVIRPIPALEIGGNISYTDAKLKTTTAIAPTLDCSGTIIPVGQEIDESCTPYGPPKWIYNIRASLDLPVPESWGKVAVYANYSHTSKGDPIEGDPYGVFPAYGLVNASLTWRGVAQSNLDLELFATNLTNKLYKNTVANLWNALGIEATVYGEPRMYGLRARYNFGNN